jgi:transcriptional regulator with XRE-family HTH domain
MRSIRKTTGHAAASLGAAGKKAVRPAQRPSVTTTSSRKGEGNGLPAQGHIKVGGNLRHARMVRGLSLRALASRVGCSGSLLSKVENDKTVPSLQMLHRIVSELGTSIGNLFSQAQDGHRIVLRKGERQVISTNFPRRLGKGKGVELEWLIPYPESHLLSGSIHIIAPGGSSEGVITHQGEEVGYVLTGRFELTVGGRIYELDAGDSFFFPSDLPHGYRNPGTAETRVLWINTPPTF